MATLYISEHVQMSTLEGNNGACVDEPGTDQAPIAIAGAAQSAAFAAGTKYIRVHTDAICSILFGANPTATTANKRLAANQTEYFRVFPGMKLSVIANT